MSSLSLLQMATAFKTYQTMAILHVAWCTMTKQYSAPLFHTYWDCSQLVYLYRSDVQYQQYFLDLRCGITP